jgi:hypothetical protein
MPEYGGNVTPMAKINGLKTFTVDTQKNSGEDVMGREVTAWIKANPFITMEEKHVVQSDNYLTLILFYSGQDGTKSPI